MKKLTHSAEQRRTLNHITMEVTITHKHNASKVGDNGHDILRELSPFPSSQTTTPSPEKGVCRNGNLPAPFLRKLYEMVENPETNSIISWSPLRESFIIWDDNKFSTQILLKYFRHCNFASFVYQLNNYGFRKIGLMQCEYANPWFQEGNTQLLKYIRRRNNQNGPQKQEFSACSVQPRKVEMEASIKRLKTAQTNFELEMGKLRQQGGKLKNELDSIEGSVKATHTEHGELLAGLVPDFIQQSVFQHLRDGQELDGPEATEKKRHIGPKSLETSGKPVDKVNTTGQSINSKTENQEEMVITGSSITGSSTRGQKENATSGNADDSAFTRKLLEAAWGQEDGGQ